MTPTTTKDTLESMEKPPWTLWAPSPWAPRTLWAHPKDTLETLGTAPRHQGHRRDLPTLQTMENAPEHLETLGTPSVSTKDAMGTPER